MKRLRFARRPNGEQRKLRFSWGTAARVGLGLLTWAALCLLLLGYDTFPGRVSLQVGDVSPSLVRARRTAQYVDREETTRLREEAAQRVLPVYTPLRFALQDAELRVRQDFAALTSARKDADPRKAVQVALDWLSTESAVWAISTPVRTLDTCERVATEALRELMSRQIRDETSDLRVAREDVAPFVSARLRDERAAALTTAVAVHELAATYHLDKEATEAAQEEARRRVQEVVRTIEADQPIIFEGERVTTQQLEMLRALGMTSPQFSPRRTAAIALFVGLIVLLLGLQTHHRAREVFDSTKKILLLSLLTVAALFLVSLLTFALPNIWMLVTPAVALMAAALLGDAVGMALALALSLLVGLMASGGLPATLLSLGSSLTALTFVAQLWPLSRLRVMVASTAAVNLVLVAAIGLLRGPQPSPLETEALLAALLYAPGAATLALGGIYVLQRPFGITTHLALLEMSNPQMPLLKRLQTEAPGTYHHSIMVANLAEAAADAVGADALLTRVGALYHDAGKLSRPGFFVENQSLLGVDNAHDKLTSSLSGLIIISHVKDGVELARQYGLPKIVQDIVEQHHGEMTMSYFYQQALSGDRPEGVTEEQFRYPGPLPNSREAAIVMLADGVHAATKSISEPTPQRIQQIVREIFRERLVGRQLEQCDLTFRQLTTAELVMARVLTVALCRDRIAYPEPSADRVEV